MSDENRTRTFWATTRRADHYTTPTMNLCREDRTRLDLLPGQMRHQIAWHRWSETGESNPDRSRPRGECYLKHLSLKMGRASFLRLSPRRAAGLIALTCLLVPVHGRRIERRWSAFQTDATTRLALRALLRAPRGTRTLYAGMKPQLPP